MNIFRLLTIAALIFTAQASLGKAPVWKVSKGDDYLFLGGTIHVLSADDYPLPKAFDTAFTDADKVYFETDMQAMNSPEVQAKLLPILTFGDGRTLKTELSEEVYAQLKAFLMERGLPIETLQMLTPAGVSMTLTMLELQRLGIADANGVDNYYASRSLKEGKDTGELETIEAQMQFLSSMNEVDGNLIIKSTLRDLGKLQEMWQQLITAWRAGDMQALEAFGVEPMQEFPTLFDLLLVQRNDDWMKKIIPMLATEEIEFLMVGSMHMVGEEGLLNQLLEAGYSIEQLE